MHAYNNCTKFETFGFFHSIGVTALFANTAETGFVVAKTSTNVALLHIRDCCLYAQLAVVFAYVRGGHSKIHSLSHGRLARFHVIIIIIVRQHSFVQRHLHDGHLVTAVRLIQLEAVIDGHVCRCRNFTFSQLYRHEIAALSLSLQLLLFSITVMPRLRTFLPKNTGNYEWK